MSKIVNLDDYRKKARPAPEVTPAAPVKAPERISMIFACVVGVASVATLYSVGPSVIQSFRHGVHQVTQDLRGYSFAPLPMPRIKP